MRYWHGLTMGLGLVSVLAFASACDDDEGDDSGSSTSSDGTSSSTTGASTSTDTGDGGTTMYWAVGEQGEMLALSPDGSADGYPLDETADLLAIDCYGSTIAWAVGTAGTLIQTSDAGQTWSSVALQADATLRAVSIVDEATIFVAGDDGTFVVTRDHGLTWDTIASDGVDYTGVATDHAGSTALLSAVDGSIWRLRAGESAVERVHEAPGEVLHAVAVSGDGSVGVAVGDLGLWLRTDDGGGSWAMQDAATTRHLHAVQVAHDGGMAVAVGQAGVVVRMMGDGPTVEETLDPALALNAVHLAAAGHGVAVGDAGVVLFTEDLGASWSIAGVATTHDLFGVDEIGLHPHL